MASKIVSATVAPGRHLYHTPVDKDGKASGAERAYKPGESIDMPIEEVGRLREMGYLVDPGGGQIVDTSGPAVLSDQR